MPAELPPPPVPSDCDCTDLDGFMLNVERLMASELVALGTHEEVAAAMFLWCRAWKQVPAASLPDDDRIIAAFARLPVPRFRKIKETVLRGFVKCSDGRLYHRFLAREALQAFERKSAFRKKRETEAERLRRWRETRKEARDETHNETVDETRFVPEGQGQGQGQGPSSLRSEESSSLRSEPASPPALPENPNSVRPKRGTRLDPTWSPTPDEVAFGRDLGFTEAALARETARFRDYWIAKPGKDGVKLDWPATLRNWLRKAADEAGIAPTNVVELPVAEAREAWAARLAYGRKHKLWLRKWGPLPGRSGCRAPPDMLRPDDGADWTEIDDSDARKGA